MLEHSREPFDRHQLSAGLEHKRDQRLRHDIRQSLSAVMCLAAIVDRDLLRGPDILGRLDQMRHELDEMTRILAQRDETRPSACVLEVGDVVAQAWAVTAGSRPCSMRLVREAPLHVLTDPAALSRAVRNLVDNAVRAAGPCGQVEVSVLRRDEEVVVDVADSGPGFGLVPAQQGLGLVTVRRFAAEVEGRLVIGRSSLGGALVSLRLPRAFHESVAEGRSPA